MEEMICKGCGAPLHSKQESCEYCGRENPFYRKQTYSITVEPTRLYANMQYTLNVMTINEQRKLLGLGPLKEY